MRTPYDAACIHEREEKTMGNKGTRLDFLRDLKIDDGYDPLADLIEDAEDDAGEHDSFAEIAPSNAGEPQGIADADKPDHRPAAERIDELFKRMAPQRRILLAILNACFVPQPNDEIDALVHRMQEENRSVFGAGTICKLLERAGALNHVLEDGTPYGLVKEEPETVVIDGVEYYQAAEPPADFWQATPEGMDYAYADDPAARLAQQLADEAEYLPIYQQILEMCSADGVTTKAIAAQVNSNPLLTVSKTKHLLATYFIERLEKCDALEWKGTGWVLTNIGSAYLEHPAS